VPVEAAGRGAVSPPFIVRTITVTTVWFSMFTACSNLWPNARVKLRKIFAHWRLDP